MPQVFIILKDGIRLPLSGKQPTVFFADSFLDVLHTLSSTGNVLYGNLSWLGSVNNLNNEVTLNSLIKFSSNPRLKTVAITVKNTEETFVVSSVNISRIDLV